MIDKVSNKRHARYFLTLTQHKWVVDWSNDHGQMWCHGLNGLEKYTWLRVMKNLQGIGFAILNLHGEYELTPEGESYKEGAHAADIVWKTPPYMCGHRFNPVILQAVSAVIGPNVHRPEETKNGAKDRWTRIRAGEVAPRERVLLRHRAKNGEYK